MWCEDQINRITLAVPVPVIAGTRTKSHRTFSFASFMVLCFLPAANHLHPTHDLFCGSLVCLRALFAHFSNSSITCATLTDAFLCTLRSFSGEGVHLEHHHGCFHHHVLRHLAQAHLFTLITAVQPSTYQPFHTPYAHPRTSILKRNLRSLRASGPLMVPDAVASLLIIAPVGSGS